MASPNRPLGKGFLTSKFKSPEVLPNGYMRSKYIRFKNAKYFAHNIKLIKKFKALAETKGVTPIQRSIPWVISLYKHLIVPLAGFS
jgi:aryl-alcohol dehydrogenase-like predicted oxidoreductase